MPTNHATDRSRGYGDWQWKPHCRDSVIAVVRPSGIFAMPPSFDDDVERIMTLGSEHGVAELNPVERTVFVISNADFEVNLGGVSGYLYNTAGDHVELLPAAFEAIGCTVLASRSKKLLDVLTALGCVPSDRSLRWETIQSGDDRIEQAMDDLERAIQDQEEDYGQALIDYHTDLT